MRLSTWVAACTAVMWLAGCSSKARPRRKKLTLYCAVHTDYCEVVKTAFEAKTGIKVSMTRKSSGETLAQVKAERRNPRGDVWWGGTGDAHIQAAQSKLTEPYRSPMVDQLHGWAVDLLGDGEHRVTGTYMGALGFTYNTEWLAAKGLPPPTRWKDLVQPHFKGEVQMANPNSSGTAYTALATFVQMFGEEEGFEYLAALHANINQYTKSGAAPTRAAGRGETGVAIAFAHDIATQIAAGFPLKVVIPEEGTGYEVGGVSIIHGARHPKSARAFVDFVLSVQGQALAEKAHSFQTPSNRGAPIPRRAPRVGADQLIDFDLTRFGSRAERSRLLERWARDIKSRPR